MPCNGTGGRTVTLRPTRVVLISTCSSSVGTWQPSKEVPSQESLLLIRIGVIGADLLYSWHIIIFFSTSLVHMFLSVISVARSNLTLGHCRSACVHLHFPAPQRPSTGTADTVTLAQTPPVRFCKLHMRTCAFIKHIIYASHRCSSLLAFEGRTPSITPNRRLSRPVLDSRRIPDHPDLASTENFGNCSPIHSNPIE